jgi:hypothetical protein
LAVVVGSSNVSDVLEISEQEAREAEVLLPSLVLWVLRNVDAELRGLAVCKDPRGVEGVSKLVADLKLPVLLGSGVTHCALDMLLPFIEDDEELGREESMDIVNRLLNVGTLKLTAVFLDPGRGDVTAAALDDRSGLFSSWVL